MPLEQSCQPTVELELSQFILLVQASLYTEPKFNVCSIFCHACLCITIISIYVSIGVQLVYHVIVQYINMSIHHMTHMTLCI